MADRYDAHRAVQKEDETTEEFQTLDAAFTLPAVGEAKKRSRRGRRGKRHRRRRKQRRPNENQSS